MATATAFPAADGVLNPEARDALSFANTRTRKIRKAASVAAFNGWVTVIFAVCSAPFALFSVAGLIVTAGLFVVAYNEFQGRRRLLQFDPLAGAFLGRNQIGFLLLIIAYCVWMIVQGLTTTGPFAAELAAKPELAEALGPLDEFDHLYRFLVLTLYGTVIVLSVVFQGLTAFYYFSRRKYVEDYVRETPQWVMDVQRISHT